MTMIFYLKIFFVAIYYEHFVSNAKNHLNYIIMNKIQFSKVRRTVLLINCLFVFSCFGYGQKTLAVPGALGFGKYVRGAYAGSSNPTILIVDTLAGESVSTGENRGSFCWALMQKFPRIILFEVSGYINLDNYIRVTDPYVSVYGQTAPGKGITITGSYVDLRTDYILLQHLRFRLKSTSTKQEDALTIFQGSNVFVDHCSFSFALDENIGVGGHNGTFKGPLTISNCILSHPIGDKDSKGILMGGTVDSISVIRNAFVHCGQRSPYIGDDILIVNVLSASGCNSLRLGIS
jgi:hypothetical protein